MNSKTPPTLTLIPLMEETGSQAPLTPEVVSQAPTGEWITMNAAALLVDVPYNDIVIAVHNKNILHSRKEGQSRLVERAQVLEKAQELKNLPVIRRPNRQLRGRRQKVTR